MIKRNRLLAMALVILGIVVVAISIIYSITEFGKVDFFEPIFRIIASLGVLLILAGVVLRVVVDIRVRKMYEEMDKPTVTLETIILSYAMINKEPRKNLKDLHFYLMSEGIAKVSLKELKVMVDKAVTNVKMDMIKPSLRAILFTEDGKLRKYQYASDFCPKCGVFKNYHKECKFCGYHEMAP